MSQPAQLNFREVLQLPAVRRLWLAQVVSVFGDFLALFAVLSDVSFRLHATPTQVTLISITFLLPFAFIGPLAGALVDRLDARRTMIASDLLRMLLALALVFAASLNQIYVILLLLSMVSTFFVPAQTVMIRSIVPPEGLLATNALISQAFQIVRIISPAIAGATVSAFGAKPCYYFDSISFTVSAGLIATITLSSKLTAERVAGSRIQSLLRDLLNGVRFIFTHATLSFVILAMGAGMFALSCFGPLIAIYVRDTLKGSELMFGVINSLIGVGMICVSPFIARSAFKLSKSALVVLGLLTMGISVCVMASVPNIAAAALGALGIGAGAVFIVVPTQTLIQQETPVELIGRVSSSMMAVLSLAQLIGLAFSGSLAQRLGIRPLFFASAVLLIIFALLGYLRLPKPAAKSTEQPEGGT